MSLVEQKRLQWAREREEMVGLCGLWGSDTSRARADHIGVPARRAHVHETFGGEEAAKTVHAVHLTLHRRPSLPPIRRPSHGQGDRDRESTPEEAGSDHSEGSYRVNHPNGPQGPHGRNGYTEEESSGYASDSAAGQEQLSWEEQQQPHRHIPAAAHADWQQRPGIHPQQRGGWTAQQHTRLTGTAGSGSGSSVSSSSWAEEAALAGRARWGDRGIGVGHLWEPCEDGVDRLPPVMLRAGAPAWMHRGLRSLDGTRDSEVTSQVLVVSHPDSPGDQGSPPGTGGTSEPDDNACRSFLRGQNVPLEADILEDRVRRRAKALEHQTAIRKQLEERDRRRKEERDRRLREERLEEERMRREQEEERRRLESELRHQREKEDQESRRASAMLEALQAAEREAKEQKRRQSRKHLAETVEAEVEAEAVKGWTSPRSSPRKSPRTSPRTSPKITSPRTPHSASNEASEVKQQETIARSPRPKAAASTPSSPETKPVDNLADRRPLPSSQGAADLAERLAAMHVAESAVAVQEGDRGERNRVPDDAAPPACTEAQPPTPSRNHDGYNLPPSAAIMSETATGWFPVLEFLQPPGPPGLHQEFQSAAPPFLPLGDGLALMMPAAALNSRDTGSPALATSLYSGGHGPRVITSQQMALLMSPMSLASGVSGTPADGHPAGTTHARLLTPTKFRRRLREAATQTSAGLRRRGGGVSSGVGRNRVGAHSRAPLVDRPKWGVNRPGTMYRTQSEKDPNYHQQRMQRLQRLQHRMLRHLRAGGSSTTTSSGSQGSGLPGAELDGCGSPSSSPRGSRGSPGGDVLSRTYRICRDEAAVPTSTTSSTFRRRPAQQAPGSRQVLRPGLHEHLYRLATAPTGVDRDSPPMQLLTRRVPATADSSRPGRFSVRESSESLGGDSGGSSGGSPRDGVGSEGSPGEADNEEAESLTEEDLLTRLSSLKQGLLMRREQLSHDLEAASPC